MSILDNAVHSIQIGVEDYQSTDIRRNVSAVRNISAGILLLYKEKLCRLSPIDDPYLLISKDIRPSINEDGTLAFKMFSSRPDKIETVNVAEIQKLFSSLKISTDWERFNRINKLRNDIEHFYAKEEPDVIREIISNCFLIIRDFLTNELLEDPLKLMGNECWNSLLEVSEIYEKELKQCKLSHSQVQWPFHTIFRSLDHLRCIECPSELIKVTDNVAAYPDIGMACGSCGHQFLFSAVIVECLHDELFADAYEAMTQGGEFPWEDCEECGLPTFVPAESACMNCCTKIEYERCIECKEPIGEYSAGDGLCDRCAHIHDMMNKD